MGGEKEEKFDPKSRDRSKVRTDPTKDDGQRKNISGKLGPVLHESVTFRVGRILDKKNLNLTLFREKLTLIISVRPNNKGLCIENSKNRGK